MSSCGECVAIVHRITDEAGKEKLVGIPANVASRITAKLLAYGKVHRASLPLAISPVTYVGDVAGKPTQLSGMAVVGVSSGILGYEALKEQTIISIDGVPTPTTTDWIIAMERAKAHDRKTVACQITTWLGESVRVAEVYLADDAAIGSMSPQK